MANQETSLQQLPIYIFFQTFVPTDAKDGDYWAKRDKNNFAARRSREARRLKENQIALRTAFLEKENHQLKVRTKIYIPSIYYHR